MGVKSGAPPSGLSLSSKGISTPGPPEITTPGKYPREITRVKTGTHTQMEVLAALGRTQQPLSCTQMGVHDELALQRAVDVMLGTNEVEKQNAAGVLAFFASTRPEICSAIARCDGIVEAVAGHITGAKMDMMHNSALLIGQLARASVAFRRQFCHHVDAMAALLNILTCDDDDDTVCNTLWALRHLVVERANRDQVLAAKSSVSALAKHSDERVAANAAALLDILRRPTPIAADQTQADDAAAGLLGILHTPPPDSAVDGKRKRFGEETNAGGEKRTKRVTDKDSGRVESDYDDEDDEEASCTLASLLTAASAQ